MNSVHKDFHIGLFRTSLRVYVARDIAKLQKKLKFADDTVEHLKNAQAFCIDQYNEGWVSIIMRDDCCPEEMAHESLHYSNTLFKKIGHKPKRVNDEIQAYVVGYVTRCCAETMMKYRKKKKRKK